MGSVACTVKDMIQLLQKLVQVEWEDSAQPVANWSYLTNTPSLEVIQCVSVGWLIDENDKVVMLVPNIGDYESGSGAQGSGFIRIPKSTITRTVELQETTSYDGLLSHPDSEQMQLTS